MRKEEFDRRVTELFNDHQTFIERKNKKGHCAETGYMTVMNIPF